MNETPARPPNQAPPLADGANALPREVLRLADLSNRRETPFALVPDAAGRAAVAAELGLSEVRKLRLEGRMIPQGRTDWRLEAQLGATVVQPCVVTLDPVQTRIDAEVLRQYLADMPEPEGAEVEMPEDDTLEPLPSSVDLGRVMLEALALLVPEYPRAEGVEELDLTVTEPGKTPLTAEDVKPFAGLAGLRDQLAGGTGAAADDAPRGRSGREGPSDSTGSD